MIHKKHRLMLGLTPDALSMNILTQTPSKSMFQIGHGQSSTNEFFIKPGLCFRSPTKMRRHEHVRDLVVIQALVQSLAMVGL